MFNRFLQQRSLNHNYSIRKQRIFTQNWLHSFWIAVTTLRCLLYHRLSTLTNALERDCLWIRESSINLNKLFIVIFVFCLRCSCSVVVACLLVNMLIFYTAHCCRLFGLFVNHVNKIIIFILEAFIYNSNNTISIFVTKWTYLAGDFSEFN